MPSLPPLWTFEQVQGQHTVTNYTDSYTTPYYTKIAYPKSMVNRIINNNKQLKMISIGLLFLYFNFNLISILISVFFDKGTLIFFLIQSKFIDIFFIIIFVFNLRI